MDKENRAMMVVLIFFSLLIGGCSLISVQIVGGDGRVNKVIDPADQTIGLVPRQEKNSGCTDGQ